MSNNLENKTNKTILLNYTPKLCPNYVQNKYQTSLYTGDQDKHIGTYTPYPSLVKKKIQKKNPQSNPLSNFLIKNV